MDILLRTTSPSLTAECQLTFNDVFRPQCDRNLAIQSLRCIRHEDSGALLKRTLDIGLIHDLLEVRRSDFLFAFRTIAASNGGDDHSEGSTCFTSYMKYKASVFGAPASSVAKIPG